ncbi:MAG: 1-acyl-sn-glycerol-3-phosphate acyltransferase [Bacteroidota bacterium]|nr:1-acyl-sn-glycerol-3-phosphate acyltransferase [Bacteroidota bacterium]
MKKAFAKIVFRLFGWHLKVSDEHLAKAGHSVMIAAPHTSNWDFLFSLSAFWIMGLDVKYFIKDPYTKGIFGGFFKWTGALGVDRTKRNNLVDHASELLKGTDQLVILVPAEGTRKRVEKWRLGFYHISQKAGVPISLGYLDYLKKEAGIADVFFPTGDLSTDLDHIQAIYQKIPGKYPQNYNSRIH